MSERREDLAALRDVIDGLDSLIADAFALRWEVTHNIGVIKAMEGLSVVDRRREDTHVADVEGRAINRGLPLGYMEIILRFAMTASVEQQQVLAKKIALVLRPTTES